MFEVQIYSNCDSEDDDGNVVYDILSLSENTMSGNNRIGGLVLVSEHEKAHGEDLCSSDIIHATIADSPISSNIEIGSVYAFTAQYVHASIQTNQFTDNTANASNLHLVLSIRLILCKWGRNRIGNKLKQHCGYY